MISVALCTYNGAKYLREQLESLAAQTMPPSEVQVGDDGSTDETLEILRSFEAPFPIHVTVNPQRLGYGENFIQTARRCTSEWVAFCDQDDVWHPDKLARCAAEFRPGVQMVAHNPGIPHMAVEPFNPRLSLRPRWFCLGFAQVFRRSLLEIKRVPLPWAEVPDAHDIWIPFVASITGDIVWINEPLVDYRIHDASVSSSLGHVELIGGLPEMEAASAIAGELGFADASAHFCRCAEMLRDHDAVQERRSVRSFAKLLVSGAYRAGSYDRLGKRALIADAMTLIHSSKR